jgi:hypothetical protein
VHAPFISGKIDLFFRFATGDHPEIIRLRDSIIGTFNIFTNYFHIVMRRSSKIGIAVIVIIASASGITLAYFSYTGQICLIPENCPALEFPVASGALNITDFNGFNIANWSGPGQNHNGMDLVTTGHNWTGMVACAPGTVVSMTENPNPYSHPAGATMFSIQIRVACGWIVDYNMEPVAYIESQRALQRQGIYVKVGDQVQTGTLIARLLCTNMTYNHVHLMLLHDGNNLCAYAYSSTAAKTIYEQIAATFNKTICCDSSGQPGCTAH